MTNEEIFESWKEAVSNTTDEILHMLEADGLTNANSHLFPDCELRELLVYSDLDEDNDEDCLQCVGNVTRTPNSKLHKYIDTCQRYYMCTKFIKSLLSSTSVLRLCGHSGYK